jgi:hypothetical protein
VLAAVEWVVLAALVALFVARGLVPAWGRVNTDFPNYYLAARLLRGGYPLERVYDWVWFQRQKDHAGIDWGIVSYGPLTPFSALVLAPFTSLPTLAAKRCWTVLNVLLLGGTLVLLRKTCRLSLRRIAIVTFLAVVPLRTNFDFGQQYVMVLFLVALAAWLSQAGKGALAGAIVAVATVLKLYPALFVVLFLLQRRWSALRGFFATVAMSFAGGVALFGIEPFRVYATRVLPRVSAGEVHDPYYLGASSPTVLLRRLFVLEPGQNPYPLVHAPTVYVLLQPTIQALLFVSAIWIVVRRRPEPAREPLLWGAFAALSLVLSTGSSTYHFCALIFATVVAVDALVGCGRTGWALCLVGLHALVCAPLYRVVPVDPSGWSCFLGVPRMFALLAYWGVFLFTLATTGTRETARRWELPVFACLFVVMTLAGMRGTSRHFDGLFESYASRLPTKTEAVVTTAPATAENAVYTSRMADDAYLLEKSDGAIVTTATAGTDLFHPSVSVARGEGWVEVAAETSRVARFPLDGPATSAADLPTEIEDAEDPSVSRDGRWVGFIREEQGRGSLWVLDRDTPHAAPRQLVDATHDVAELAFFPDDRIVFTARDATGFSLFVTSTAPGPVTSLSVHGRYPAISPDGLRLAYSRLEHGCWQLALADLVTHAGRDLTRSDCNSLMPAWTPDGGSLVYASDCGRGLGATALCEIPIGDGPE